jgi:anti-sigma28 factor (negative regulator of flagellin synthesis)
MQDLSSIGNRTTGFVPTLDPKRSEAAPGQTPPRSDPPPEATDRVELSTAAMEAQVHAEALSAEQQRISAIKAQIASGTYLTPGKLEAVVDMLYAELSGRG